AAGGRAARGRLRAVPGRPRPRAVTVVDGSERAIRSFGEHAETSRASGGRGRTGVMQEAPGNPATPRRRSTDVTFELATASDEPRLRQLLREAPMQGDVRLAMEREPDFFQGLSIEGDVAQVLVARDRPTGAIVSMGTRSARDG